MAPLSGAGAAALGTGRAVVLLDPQDAAMDPSDTPDASLEALTLGHTLGSRGAGDSTLLRVRLLAP